MCVCLLAAHGVGERNVVEKIVRSQAEIRNKLFELLIKIILVVFSCSVINTCFVQCEGKARTHHL